MGLFQLVPLVQVSCGRGLSYAKRKQPDLLRFGMRIYILKNFENWLLGVIRSWARQAREIFRLFVSYIEVKLHNRPRRFSMILHTHICNGLIDKT